MLNLKKTKFPFRVDKFPFFYGWVILIAGTIGVVMSIPGQTMGVSVFTDSLINALGIQRTSLSFAYLLGTVTSGLMITRAGKYYDKYGARIMAMVSGFMLGLIVIGMTKIDVLVKSLSGLFQNVNYNIIAIVFLVIGFWGIRFFGQGVLTMVSRNMVMKWFEQHRGLANAVDGGICFRLAFRMLPACSTHLIGNDGWRGPRGQKSDLFVGIGFVIFLRCCFSGTMLLTADLSPTGTSGENN